MRAHTHCCKCSTAVPTAIHGCAVCSVVTGIVVPVWREDKEVKKLFWLSTPYHYSWSMGPTESSGRVTGTCS